MTNTEYRRFRQHILDYMDGDIKELKDTVKTYKKLRYVSDGTTWGAAQTMCQYGVFDIYCDQVMETLEKIYGDDFKESKYITKDGEYRYKNNEAYCWTIYKAKIARTIEIMEKKGEI